MTNDTQALTAITAELIEHVRALRNGEPLSAMHRAQALECLDALAGEVL